jgi:hypothetical protein
MVTLGALPWIQKFAAKSTVAKALRENRKPTRTKTNFIRKPPLINLNNQPY